MTAWSRRPGCARGAARTLQSEQSVPLQPQNGLRRWRSGRRTVRGGRLPQSRGHTTGGSGNTSRLGAPTAPLVMRPDSILQCCRPTLTAASWMYGPMHVSHRLSSRDTAFVVLTPSGHVVVEKESRLDRRLTCMPLMSQGCIPLPRAARGGALGAGRCCAHLAPERL